MRTRAKPLKALVPFISLTMLAMPVGWCANSLGEISKDTVNSSCTNEGDAGADLDNPQPLNLSQVKARKDSEKNSTADATPSPAAAGAPGSASAGAASSTPTQATATQKNASAQAQVASGSDVLKQFSATNATNSTVVTSHVLTALTPAWLDKDDSKNTHFYNAAGWDISAALPVNTATLQDYTKQELLGRYTGVLTLFTSFAGRNPCNQTYQWKDRAKNVNRLYLKDLILDQSPPTAKEYMMFLSQGIGIRALKTKLANNQSAGTGTGSTSQSSGGYAGGGMAFLGLGADGPLFDVNETDPNATGGLISFEFFGAAHVLNAHTLNTLLGTTNAHSIYYTAGANILLTMPNNFYLNLEYSKPLTAFMKAKQSDLTMITVGYTLPSSGSNANNSSNTPPKAAPST